LEHFLINSFYRAMLSVLF